ncbi:MAG: ubiquinol-cytochrome C chaperone family protein [Rhodospirillales bacterium]
MGLAKSDLIIRHADAHVQGPSGGFSLNSVRWVMILSLFKRSSGLTAARGLYGDIVRQARLPVFYGKEGGVADSEDGRYDLILLHVFLVLERLGRITPDPSTLKQDLFDVLFEDLDLNLREMGYGDEGVRRRIQRMVEGFYGRMTAYRDGLAGDDDTLFAALKRNLYRNTEPDDAQVARLAGYIRNQTDALNALNDADFLDGKVGFSPPKWAANPTEGQKGGGGT